MAYPRLLLPLCLLILSSCRQNPDAPPATPTDHIVQEEPEAEPAPTETPGAAPAAQATPTSDTTQLPAAPDTPLKILLEGTYYKNEVWSGAEKKEWLGLYHENGVYVLRPAALQINSVTAPNADSAGIMSGREVVAADSNALFFITGLRNPATGAVDTAIFSKITLAANRVLTYSFKGKEYRIKAYGDSVQAATGEYSYQRYGWRAVGSKNGRKVEQTLAEDQDFNDSIYILLWAGDLDRDGIPDLLLDLSNHYYMSRYALFLSSMAERGKLYRKVAEFKTVGG